ncbi:hypothetical protein FRC02_002114 [Tulasnella sp. 418]|nr:hypothetical protein FRC02_002114 [Tulasnella sp. 418]
MWMDTVADPSRHPQQPVSVSGTHIDMTQSTGTKPNIGASRNGLQRTGDASSGEQVPNTLSEKSCTYSEIVEDVISEPCDINLGTSLSAMEKLNRKSDFWDEYGKLSKEYDEQLVKDLGDDLNSLLTFAGLFSATNTAFIVETMNDLKEDTAKTTNNLLRSIARGLRDPTLTDENSQTPVFKASQRAIRVNALLFASLCCSLFTALGAILGKQWLNHYGNGGSVKVLSVKCRERQRKLIGLERWHLETILETLPTLLQFSLFLFLVAVFDVLWDINHIVAAVVLGFFIMTLSFYITTAVISVYDPASPFQNRFTRLLRRLMVALLTQSRFIIPWLKLSGRRVQKAMKKHRQHFVWTWPVVIFSLNHYVFDYAVEAISPGEFFLYVPCIFLEGPVRSLSNRFFTAARLLGIHRFFEQSRGPAGVEVTEDTLGAQCVTWLWEHRSPDPSTDDAVLEVARDLNAFDVAVSGYLCSMISILLKPVRINGVVVSLNVDNGRLRDFLEPLSRWISKRPSEAPYYFEDTEMEDATFFSIWRHLGARFWQLLAENPDDQVAVRSIADILKMVDSLYGRFRWSLSTPEGQKMYVQDAIRIQDHFSTIAGESPTHPMIVDYLTILGCIYWGCSDSQRSHLLSLESANRVKTALVSSLTIQGRPDGEQWRGRLRLLYLRERPEFYSSISHEPDHFAGFLEQWLAEERSILPRWIRWLRPHRNTPTRLYLDAIKLLLTKDHNIWHPRLDSTGHFGVIRQLMTVQGTEMFFSWQWKGKKLLPLECILTVWYHQHTLDPTSSQARTYLTPRWVQSITSAISLVGSIKTVSEVERREFSPNMMEPELLTPMMTSLREYLRVLVSNGLLTGKKISILANHYRGIGRVLEDWAPSPFSDISQDYRRDDWRNDWRNKIQGECQKLDEWQLGLANSQA